MYLSSKIVYMLSYILFNVSHQSAVSYNIDGANYNQLKGIAIGYTLLAIFGWIITNMNTNKY